MHLKYIKNQDTTKLYFWQWKYLQQYTWLEYWSKLEDKWSESKGYGWCIQAISHWGVGSASLLDFEHDKTWLYANKKRQIWSGHKEILPHMMKLVEKTESIHFSCLPYFAQFGLGCLDILTETVTWIPAFLKSFQNGFI